ARAALAVANRIMTLAASTRWPCLPRDEQSAAAISHRAPRSDDLAIAVHPDTRLGDAEGELVALSQRWRIAARCAVSCSAVSARPGRRSAGRSCDDPDGDAGGTGDELCGDVGA